jgi:DNA-binding HxlR family transcriptional regulator
MSITQTIDATNYEEITVGCSMGGLLEMLTRPWTLHILWLLSRNGPMRFGVLRRSIEGISARLLTVRLRTLEERGFIERSVRATNPPEVTYIPTPRLADMEGFMQHLHTLSDKWKTEDAAKYGTAGHKPTLVKRSIA